MGPDVVRIAAVSDIHYSKNSPGALQPLFAQITESADILVLAGDLTDYGLPDEGKVLARDLTAIVKIPIVAVLGNHDYESGEEGELVKILSDAGVKMLDGDTFETHGVGFAGVRGFCGGFGRGALGEPLEIYPFLGSSRLEEPLARFDVTAVFHGHAHKGKPEGATSTGIPVFNVAHPVLKAAYPDRPAFRLLEVRTASASEAEVTPITERRQRGRRSTDKVSPAMQATDSPASPAERHVE
jgi:Icc-related predicted phosphoesterase